MIEWLRSDFEDDPVVDTKVKSTAATASAMIRKDKTDGCCSRSGGSNNNRRARLNKQQQAYSTTTSTTTTTFEQHHQSKLEQTIASRIYFTGLRINDDKFHH